jgi:hypothetical protein
MRVTEAQWIAEQLSARRPEEISPLLNIGSSTKQFREVRQPHIDALIFAPLRAAGVEVIHTDIKAEPGVDVAGDLLAPSVQDQLRALRPRAALSSNLLEHVTAPGEFARIMASLVVPDGTLVVTVPRSYPYHADPIDTGFRPSPHELAALFPQCELRRGDIVEDTTYGEELLGRGTSGLWKGLRDLVAAVRRRGDVARAYRDRLRWLSRPFTTTCVVLERTS